MSKPIRIEDLDRNFKGQSPEGGLCWLDAFDPRLALRGHGWLPEAYEARSFQRFPERFMPQLTEAVQSLSRCPAGLFIAFRTDARQIAVRQVNSDTGFMAHMPMSGSAGSELYLFDDGAWLPAATAIPNAESRGFERVLITRRSPQMREFRLYLPLYKRLEQLELGFPPEAVVEPVPAPEGSRPSVFYGTSITQGGCASTPGSDFVALTGRLLGTEALNYGFSGNGKGEPDMARTLATIDAGMFVLDYLANASLDILKQTLVPFIRILRESHPQTPIVLLGRVTMDQFVWDHDRHDDCLSKRAFLMRTYVDLLEAGDRHIHFIDGHGLLPGGETGAFVDGVHPTSAGFVQMAGRLVPQLRMIRLREQA